MPNASDATDPPRDGRAILEGLATPGRQLVFVDETGTSGKPLERLAGDFMLFCGVSLPSACYAGVRDAMRDRLARLGGPEEFHAAEIFSPKRTSRWNPVSFEERVSALRLLTQLLLSSCPHLYFCYVSGEQYSQMLETARAEVDLSLSQKQALRKVFFGRLLEVVGPGAGRPVAVVADADEHLPDRIKIRALSPAIQGVYEDGVIEAESQFVEGLQLADWAAYVFNRAFHSIARGQRGDRLRELDEVVLTSIVDLRPRFVNLLDPVLGSSAAERAGS